MSRGRIGRKEFVRSGLLLSTYFGACLTEAFAVFLDPFYKSDAERDIQERYGVHVIGRYDQKDLENLLEVLRGAEASDMFWSQINETHYLKTSRDLNLLDLLRSPTHLNPYVGLIKMYGQPLDDIDSAALVHELAHIWHLNLDSREDFDAAWSDVAGIRYRTLYDIEDDEFVWKEGGVGPMHGCVQPSGSVQMIEDIATFCEAAFRARTMSKEELERGGVVVEDPRYEQKLDLLVDSRFISDAERRITGPYIVTKPILDSLAA